VRSDNLSLPVTAYKGVPYLVAPCSLILLHYNEQRAVPPCHAIWLLIPEDQVLEIFLFIASVFVLVCEEGGVDLATLVGGRTYVDLSGRQRSCFGQSRTGD
jgi:hypothetical protein